MLRQLFEIIEARKASMPEGSYTAHLLAAGEGEILRKVREESAELIHAAEQEGDQRLLEELADLFYHSLVLLAARDLHLEDLEAELRRRNQQSE
ncbi:MAG: phosphoribosyl-ATP diphosphatase [Acidobacteria bacterium]|nr:phosphoribosyl-ATP diphosphatase [Acidobacteriota bacterium]